MSPPRELPGFYFDPEKNRYFPINGPIPGSKRPASSSSGAASDEPAHIDKKHHTLKQHQRNHAKVTELLRVRELHGKHLISMKHRYYFEHEYQKLQASHPMVVKYPCGISDSALEHMYGTVQTQSGLKREIFLATGSIDGSMGLYGLGNIGKCYNYNFEYMPQPVWGAGNRAAHGSIWRSRETYTTYSSSISCIKSIGHHSPDLSDNGSLPQKALVATLGSGASGGSIYILNLSDPLDFTIGFPSLCSRSSRIASSDCTIWSADCNYNGTQAVIGTNLGAAMVDLETGKLSWLYHNKSDIFSQQFDLSGNVVICGHRNGAIIPVDIRQQQSRYHVFSARLPPLLSTIRRTFHAPTSSHDKEPSSKLERNSTSYSAFRMSSAVCSLVTLKSDDRYFLGSSMDGSINLFDHRLLKKGAVQTYEGHVNSHMHVHLGVNPSETLVMAGGVDGFVRIWSIKTGELLFGERITDAVLPTICWPKSVQDSYGMSGSFTRFVDRSDFDLSHSWGVWLGSREGLYYMHGS